MPLNLIYILSSGHSGSTLTDLILGAHSSLESVGELNKLPEYISPKSHRTDDRKICTCGVHISKCEYWNSILNKLDYPSAYEINNLDNFNQNNYELIKKILQVSGKSILIDSSKNPNRLKNLIESNQFDITVLHLIRDGRAVGYSGQRKQTKLQQEFGSDYKKALNKMNKKNEFYEFYNAVKRWNYNNLSNYYKFSNEPRVNYFSLKYENLVNNPSKELSDIFAKLGLSFEEKQLNFSEMTHHNIAGNRMRLAKNTTIALDEEYKRNLSFIQWWRATYIAHKALRLFKYPLRRK